MPSPQFDITIGSDGKVRVKVSGATGDECIALTDMLRDIIGREDQRDLTSEYYGPGGQVRIDTEIEGHTKG